jgi:hypothetical protein
MERSKIYLAAIFAILAAAVWAVSQPQNQWLSDAARHIQSPLSFLANDHPTDAQWDILQHLGGDGPWIQKTDNVLNHSIDVPEGCRVDQVHMVGLLVVGHFFPV